MTVLLPTIASEHDYSKVYADTSVWLPAAKVIGARHGLAASELRRATLGTNVVFRTETRILKLFCGLWYDDFRSEYAALSHVQGLPVPEIIAAGELEGWPYLVMSIVPGVPALEVWGSLDLKIQTSIMRELGQLLRQLHGHPPVAELATDWSAFLRERIARSDAHHRADEPWRTWIRERVTGFAEPSFEPVLLNADITEDHLLLSERGGSWGISGLIDFGDARMGHAYYDFVAPLAFYTFGQPSLSHSLVESYGLQLTAEVMGRLTTYCLLHEFGRIEAFLSRFAVPDGEAFHRALWGDG